MFKPTRKHKRKKRKKRSTVYRRVEKLKLDILKKKARPGKASKMEYVQMPDLFPEKMPKEERLKLVKSIGEKAKKDFDEKYPSIQNWFNEYDPIYLLSYFAFYFVTYPEGEDPELTGSIEFYPHYLEIMQALALYQNRNYLIKPLMQNVETLKKEIKEIGDLIQLKQFNILKELQSDEEFSAYNIRADMMTQTTAIRNWAYIHQMRKVVGDLSKLVGAEFEKIYGIDPYKFMETLFVITEEREDLLNKHLKKGRLFWKKKNYKEMIEAYNKAFPKDIKVKANQIEELWVQAGKDLNNLRGMIACHYDLKLEKIFSFDLNHFVSLYGDNKKKEKIKDLLDRLSYNFGDLKDFPKDFIILDNPVHHRPFIKINNNSYYSAVFFILPHLALGLFEDLIANNSNLRKKYNDKIKPKYLEDEIERLFRFHFPSAKIFRGSQWKEKQKTTLYENDLIAIIDTFALIVEAKSGSVTPPAKRGAPKRLFETLRDLIEGPSEQANRFIAYLKNNKAIHTFRNKKGENNVIDSSKIHYYIPLGVTLAHLGMISSNLKKIIEAGIIKKKISELAPSISLTDLESVFELLPLEAEKIHYFVRRREIEDHVTYGGDELDLLSFYLGNGFNIGEIEYSGEFSLVLLLESKNLDPYFVGTYQGKNVEKPELTLSEWWKDLLNQIAKRKPKNWIETSYILLNSTEEDQLKFEKNLKNLISRIKSGRVDKKHNWVAFLSGPERRRYLIVGYPYTSQDEKIRDSIIATIINSDQTQKARGIVVIGTNLNRLDYPYSVLAGKLETDLFDI